MLSIVLVKLPPSGSRSLTLGSRAASATGNTDTPCLLVDRLDGLGFSIKDPSLSTWDKFWLSVLVLSDLDIQGGVADHTEE